MIRIFITDPSSKVPAAKAFVVRPVGSFAMSQGAKVTSKKNQNIKLKFTLSKLNYHMSLMEETRQFQLLKNKLKFYPKINLKI